MLGLMIFLMVAIAIVLYFKEDEEIKIKVNEMVQAESPKEQQKREFEEGVVKTLKEKGHIKYITFMNSINAYSREYIAIVNNQLRIKLTDGIHIFNIHKILEVEVNYKVLERNTMRMMTIMPTYDKNIIVQGTELILYMEDSDDFLLTMSVDDINPILVKKLKLLLEKIMNEEKVNN